MLAGLAALFAAAAVHFQGDAAVCTVARGGQHGAAVVCLDWRGYYTMWVTLVSLVLMARDAPPDLVLSGATLSLLLLRVITDAEALRGFASPSIATVGVLFVLAKALEQTGAVDALVVPALGAPRSHTAAVLHVCVPTALLSAFLNNTPIVAMLIPACETLARRHRLSARVLLMPLSFASMLGGMCTLIGTSTNLVLDAQIKIDPSPPCKPFHLFAMTPAALPTALAGLALLALLAPAVLAPRAPLDPTPGAGRALATGAALGRGGYDVSLNDAAQAAAQGLGKESGGGGSGGCGGGGCGGGGCGGCGGGCGGGGTGSEATEGIGIGGTGGTTDGTWGGT